MKQFDPIKLKQEYFQDIEKAVIDIIYDELYAPLIEVLQTSRKKIENSKGGVVPDAIRKGKIWIDKGRLYGTFSAKISRELKSYGAVYDKRSKSWKIDTIPPEISSAHAFAVNQYTDVKKAVVTQLGVISTEKVLTSSALDIAYKSAVNRMDHDIFQAAKRVTIPPKMTQEARDAIAAEWSQNMSLNIKKWTDENVKKLREEIEKNTFKGNRAEDMVSHISRSYQASQRKAKFLAKQETSLLMSKFREQRYKSVGVTKYRWSTSGDQRVRDDHADLNGKVIRWDAPPIVDKKTGRRAHAGEDFECRCVAIPLID